MLDEAEEINPDKLAKPPTLRVVEAFKAPFTLSIELTVEEAWEINPPPRVDKLATLRVEEADNGPLMFSWAETVDEAEEINPLDIVSMVVEAVVNDEWPRTDKVEVEVNPLNVGVVEPDTRLPERVSILLKVRGNS